MQIVLPLPIVVAQWTALFALGLLVVIFYRQLAVLLAVKERAHTDPASLSGLSVGSALPSLAGELFAGRGPETFTWKPGHPSGSLLLFADPVCGSCEMAVGALNALIASGRVKDVDTLIVTSEEPELVRAVETFRTSVVPVVRIDKGVAVEEFRVRATPLFYVAGADGRVVALGPGHDEKDIRRFLRELDRPRSIAHSEMIQPT